MAERRHEVAVAQTERKFRMLQAKNSDAPGRLSEQIADWLDNLVLSGKSPATCKTYRHFVVQLQNAEPREVLRRYLGVLRSAQTCHNALASFNRYQVDRGWASAISLPSPRGVDRAPKPFLTEEQVQRVYEACDSDSSRLMIRLLLTGLRVSELCNARMKELRGNRLTIAGKGGKMRTVILDANTLALLSAGPALLDLKPNTVRRRLEGLGVRTGIHGLTPHTFRRTFASLGLLAGMDSRHLRTLGGWSSEKVFSERYVAYVLEEAALDQAERFGLTARLLDAPTASHVGRA